MDIDLAFGRGSLNVALPAEARATIIRKPDLNDAGWCELNFYNACACGPASQRRIRCGAISRSRNRR